MAGKKSTKGTRAGRDRRGKGEAMTGAKEGQVEVRAPVTQHDLLLPSEDVYKMHRAAVKKALDAKKTAVGNYTAAIEKAKLAGIDTDMMLEAFNIVRDNDPKALMSRLNQLNFCLEQEGFSIHITIHDTLAGDEMAMIYRRYYADGKAGKTLDNRYPEGTDLHAQANRAWRHGNALNLGVSAEDADKALGDDMPDIERSLPPPPNVGDLAQPTTH